MVKKVMSILLTLAMVSSFTACFGGGELPSAEDILDRVVASSSDVATYRCDLDVTISMALEGEGEEFEATMVTTTGSVVDLPGKQMEMDMTMGILVTDEDEMEVGLEMYLVDGVAYMLMDDGDSLDMWLKAEVPEEYWAEIDQIASQTELLGLAQIEVVGVEKVGGVDCYVVQISADAEQLWQMMAEQPGMMDEMDTEMEQLFQEIAFGCSAKQWIAQDTYFLVKSEMGLSFEIDAEDWGIPVEEGGSISMVLTMDMQCYDYNQPVVIDLPPEAEEAIEVPFEYIEGYAGSGC